jgi:hypothetical protein
MKKDPNRYTPRPYGHAAPWNRQPEPTPYARAAAQPRAAAAAVRWPWVVLATLVVGAVGWLVCGAAFG